MVFTPDGKLIIAYRLPKSENSSCSLRLLKVNPVTGKQTAARSYEAPSVGRVRIPDSFLLNRKRNIVYYAELRSPGLVLAVDAATLKIVGRSTDAVFGESDYLPRIEGSTATSLFMAALSPLAEQGKPGSGVVASAPMSQFVTARSIQFVVADAQDVSRITKTFRFAKRGWPVGLYALSSDGESLWMGGATQVAKFSLTSGAEDGPVLRAGHRVSSLFVLSNKVLGITDNQVEGWLQLFDQNGNEIRTLQQSGCGFVSASFSSDERYGVTICDKTGMGESDFGKTRERRAVVFDVQSLAVVTTFPLPKQTLRGGVGAPPARTAYPLPAIWHDRGRLLVAVPDWSGFVTIRVFRVP